MPLDDSRQFGQLRSFEPAAPRSHNGTASSCAFSPSTRLGAVNCCIAVGSQDPIGYFPADRQRGRRRRGWGIQHVHHARCGLNMEIVDESAIQADRLRSDPASPPLDVAVRQGRKQSLQ